MAVSEQRLTLFALISEFEADARDLIAKTVCSDHTIERDVGSEAYEGLKLRAVRAFSADEVNDTLLVTFLDLGDAIKILLSNRSLLSPQLSSALTKTSKQLEMITAVRNRVMHRRPLEFDDLPLVSDVFRVLVKATKPDFRRLSDAFNTINSNKLMESYAKGFSYEPEPTVLNNLPQPDFEDTGFLGRRDQIEELRKAISGPYPVITVLGVGGAGKSALALHVAYDVLNSSDCKYDAIIWTSAKTSRLTGADVQDIVGSISSSIGIAEAALQEFGPVTGEDYFSQLQELLSSFKILLFIDNLETILDEKIRSFVRDVPTGSKIVFTSRIGLGAYDFTVPIKNLDARAAWVFFRRVASIWKNADLVQLSNEAVASYCVRLNHSPLGIKWFVQALAAGASGQSLLANPKALLSFCLENIVDKLDSNALSLLNILAVTAREQSPASLHYISEIDPWIVEDALRQLIASHLVTVIVSTFGEEDRYQISSIAQTYISRLHAPSAPVQIKIRQRQAQLNLMSERAELSRGSGYVYDPAHIFIREDFSGTDSVAASYLRRAFVAARKQDWDAAFFEIEKAKQINPSYFEVLKTEAYISSLQGNVLLAQDAYKEAIALRPSYPPLNVLYAGFLMKSLGNGSAAEVVLKDALIVEPDAPTLKMELARCQLYQGKYDDSWNMISSVNSKLLANGKASRMFYDILVQVCSRSAASSLEVGNSEVFMHSMAWLNTAVGLIPPLGIDAQVEKNLKHAVAISRKFVLREDNPALAVEVRKTIDRVCSLLKSADPSYVDITNDETSRYGGKVSFLPTAQPFGFIEADDGERLFFHRNNLLSKNDFDRIDIGTAVAFSLSSNAQGPCADDVALAVL